MIGGSNAAVPSAHVDTLKQSSLGARISIETCGVVPRFVIFAVAAQRAFLLGSTASFLVLVRNYYIVNIVSKRYYISLIQELEWIVASSPSWSCNWDA